MQLKRELGLRYEVFTFLYTILSLPSSHLQFIIESSPLLPLFLSQAIFVSLFFSLFVLLLFSLFFYILFIFPSHPLFYSFFCPILQFFILPSFVLVILKLPSMTFGKTTPLWLQGGPY